MFPKILRRHWLATLILIGSVGVMIWYGYQDYTPKIPATAEKRNEIVTSTEKEPDIPEQKSVESIPIQKPENKEEAPTPTSTVEDKGVDKGVETTFVINGQAYPLQVLEGTSVYDAMRILDGNKITVDFKSYSGLGHFVEGINGQKSDTIKGKYWIYYINGDKAQVGISNYFLKANDIITWKYEDEE